VFEEITEAAASLLVPIMMKQELCICILYDGFRSTAAEEEKSVKIKKKLNDFLLMCTTI
jgi:hypothetical protein